MVPPDPDQSRSGILETRILLVKDIVQPKKRGV
jgi:hypothetical protein